MREMGSDFVKAICICLLSPRTRCDQEPKLSDVALQYTTKTPLSDQQKASAADKAGAPKFLSGYHHGLPVSTKIRVASDEVAHAIWQLKRQQDASTARSGVAVPVHGKKAAGVTLPKDNPF
jgi:hypothetical protein